MVVAMSGGVDSSVAAALLKEQGYDVYGVTMRLADWQATEGPSSAKATEGQPSIASATEGQPSIASATEGQRTFGGCCGSKDFYDARSVAQTLGIPHYSFDYVEKFRGSVIGYFKDSYLKAETPNPCIACNRHVKFGALLEKALALGADYLATGHYARIDSRPRSDVRGAAQQEPTSRVAGPESGVGRRTSDEFVLKKAVDPAKDQSYVLYGLGQKELSRLLFPLGGLMKQDVRKIARRYNLRTADKPDSYEICFVPNEDYRQFLTEEVPESRRPSGPIRHVDGRVLGTHHGLPFYTIGQREGLGISVGRPLYVTALEQATNTLVVGSKEDVLSTSCVVRELSWVSGEAPSMPAEVTAKIRSRHVPSPCTLSRVHAGEGESDAKRSGEGEGRVFLTFGSPQSAVTPGQVAVFYQGDEVLGGGVIDHAEK